MEELKMDNQHSHPPDTWANGAAYEPYVGRWSRVVARQFLSWLDVSPGSRWLDVGCGTGALSQTILELASPAAIKGIDRSEGFAAFAQAHTQDARAQFQVGDAVDLPVETGTYDAAISGLMLNFVPDHSRAVAEMARAVRPGGVVAVYVWDYADKMQFMRYFWDAAAAVDPQGLDLDEGRRFPVCNPQILTELFQAANLKNVESRPIDIDTNFKDFDDYWLPFLGGQGAAPSYNMSLSEELRTALRERLRNALPIAPDGSIPLVARAWAVRGTR
jgi:SAM-dependent methyltransferase